MPTKRRRMTRARMTPEAEAELWTDVFDGGDFLLAGNDRELGIEFTGRRWDRAEMTPEYRAWHEEVLKPAAREAWHRLGADYLAGARPKHRPHLPARGEWAMAKFGRPGGAEWIGRDG